MTKTATAKNTHRLGLAAELALLADGLTLEAALLLLALAALLAWAHR